MQEGYFGRKTGANWPVDARRRWRRTCIFGVQIWRACLLHTLLRSRHYPHVPFRADFQSKGLVGLNHNNPQPAETQCFLYGFCMCSVRRLSGSEAVGRRATVSPVRAQDLLVEGLGVGGGSRDVGVAGRLVGAGGEF